MIKLLRSNLLRLIKSKAFYVVLAIQAGIVMLETVNYYLAGLNPNVDVYADFVFRFTACTEIAPILLAVACSLFIGADYHNGTIRNKLIIGHPRIHVYLANLITTMITALCMNLAAMLVFYPITLPLLGGFASKPEALLTIFFVGNFIMLVYASLYTMATMISKSTVASLIITIGSLFVMLIIAQYLFSEINAPLTYPEVTMNEFGEMITQTVPNVFRKSDGVLKFFKVLLNIFPSGQMTILGTDNFELWQTLVSGICLLGISTSAGIAIFSKENLK